MAGEGVQWRLCRTCGYDVTSLPLPGLCPECGDVLTTARRANGYIETVVDVTFRPWRLLADTFIRPPELRLWSTNAVVACVLATLLVLTPHVLAALAWRHRLDDWMATLLLWVVLVAHAGAIIPLTIVIVEAVVTAVTRSGRLPRRVRESCQAYAAAVWPGLMGGSLLIAALVQSVCILLEKLGAIGEFTLPGLILLPATMLLATFWQAMWLGFALRTIGPRAARHVLGAPA